MYICDVKIYLVGRDERMINFVIMEDNKRHLRITKKYIKKYMVGKTFEYEIYGFSKISSKFTGFVKRNVFKNIYILDYDLGADSLTNGVDAARIIRQYDWTSPIVFLSVNGKEALDVFKSRLQILDFVDKQVNPELELRQIFKICFQQLQINDTLKINRAGKTYCINCNDILYIYRDTVDRKSVVVTDKNIIPINLPLHKVYGLLPLEFRYSHKSYILNTDRVEAYDWDDYYVIFDNGSREPLISRTHKKELNEIMELRDK